MVRSSLDVSAVKKFYVNAANDAFDMCIIKSEFSLKWQLTLFYQYIIIVRDPDCSCLMQFVILYGIMLCLSHDHI